MALALEKAEELISRKPLRYQPRFGRDPFKPFVPIEIPLPPGVRPVDPLASLLTGVIAASSGNLALVRDQDGIGRVLRVGEPVRNGYVEAVTQTELVITTVEHGVVGTLTLTMAEAEAPLVQGTGKRRPSRVGPAAIPPTGEGKAGLAGSGGELIEVRELWFGDRSRRVNP